VAQTKAEQRAGYPLAAYNFRVTVDAQALSFAKVSGLHREHQTLTYRHGLSFLEGEYITKYRIDKYVSVTLERGTTLSMRFLQTWLEEQQKRQVEISLCDEAGTPVLAWRIARAIAVKLTAPTFDARTSEAAIDTLELKAAGISLVYLT
jgi:phage tail-like protein